MVLCSSIDTDYNWRTVSCLAWCAVERLQEYAAYLLVGSFPMFSCPTEPVLYSGEYKERLRLASLGVAALYGTTKVFTVPLNTLSCSIQAFMQSSQCLTRLPHLINLSRVRPHSVL